jgi:hypothetical protein
MGRKTHILTLTETRQLKWQHMCCHYLPFSVRNELLCSAHRNMVLPNYLWFLILVKKSVARREYRSKFSCGTVAACLKDLLLLLYRFRSMGTVVDAVN